jgi:hypothetical protein
MRYNIIILLATALAISSCEKDVTIDVPVQSPKLVIESNNRLGQRFTAYITRSVDVLAPINSSPLTNAFVTLFQDNVLRDTLVYNSNNRLYAAKNNTRPVAGGNYTIKATAAGLAPVEATSKAPVPVPIQSLTYRPRFRSGSSGEELDEIKFSFQDPAGKADYYMVRIRVPSFAVLDTVTYFNVGCLRTVDPDAETGLKDVGTSYDACIEQDFVMKDVRFEGRVKEVTLQVRSGDIGNFLHPTTGILYRPVVELTAITEAYYRYYKSQKIYEDAQSNPFAEPVSVYTNITGGYGIFAAYGAAYKVIF